MTDGTWCTVREAAYRLGVYSDAIRDMIIDGKIESITVYAPNNRRWEAVLVTPEHYEESQ